MAVLFPAEVVDAGLDLVEAHVVCEVTVPEWPVPFRDPVVPTGYMFTNRHLRFAGLAENGACSATEHAHAEHVVFWPKNGTGSVEIARARNNITVGRGLWVPAGTPHRTVPLEVASMCVLYIDPQAWIGEPGEVRTVEVNSALREMLLHLAVQPMPKDTRLRAQRVCLELITEANVPGLEVPVPADPRALTVARVILRNPADDRSLEDWAWQTNMSARTIARAFRSDTGMTFSQWRTAARMSAAAGFLTDGVPVGTVSRRVGYTSVSAFSAAFRRLTGRSPHEFHP